MSTRPSRWSALVRWRNWRLPVKLAAVTAVPVLLAIALGVLTVQDQVQRAALYERSDRLVVLGDKLLGLVHGLQGERTASVAQLTGVAGDQAGPATDPESAASRLRQARQVVDSALVAVRAASADLVRPSESIRTRLDAAELQIGQLQPLREQVAAGADPGAVNGGYGAITEGLLDVDRALASDIADPELARVATALYDLTVATDQLHLQHALVATAIARGWMTPADHDLLRASYARLADKVDDFRAAASPTQLEDYRRTLDGPAAGARDEQVRRLLELPADYPLPVTAAEWDGASSTTIGLTSDVATRLDAGLRQSSSVLQVRASDRAGLASVVLFAALVLTAGVAMAVARQLLGSLGALRRTALRVADRDLPAALATIRDGTPHRVTVRPVPVDTTEDVGELARAFDAVHRQALRLATDEAMLRTGYSSVFVNLSRRSQSLVQRQLQLLERLERHEEDAEQLATLFQLDHLATRMRRNNENLMVLSGNDPARRAGEPSPVVDLLRAAISEIEHYQRVELRQPPPLAVVGHAAGDLVRLVAELLDNATTFSPPDTAVTIGAHRCDNGSLVVNVVDHGIGMSDDEIAQANERLQATGPVDLPASRRMGLFVVGRLAVRHGFGVKLHGGGDLQGVQASVTVPAGLVVAVRPSRQSATPAAAHAVASGSPAGAPVVASAARTVEAAQAAEAFRAGATATAVAPGGSVLPKRQPGGSSLRDPVTGAAGSDALPTRPANGATRNGVAHPPPTRNGHPRQGPPLGEWPSWWDSDSPPQSTPVDMSNCETTPIFDQMVSAWFQVPDSPPSRWPNADPDSAAAARAKPADAAAAAAAANAPVVNGAAPAAPGAPAPGGVNGASAAAGVNGTAPAAQAAPGTQAAQAGPAPAVPAGGVNGRAWESAADSGWTAARAVSAAAPSEYTPAGLPKRTPRQSLLPGSVATAEPAGQLGGRDAEQVRGRLSSFRAGVDRGRHSIDNAGRKGKGE